MTDSERNASRRNHALCLIQWIRKVVEYYPIPYITTTRAMEKVSIVLWVTSIRANSKGGLAFQVPAQNTTWSAKFFQKNKEGALLCILCTQLEQGTIMWIGVYEWAEALHLLENFLSRATKGKVTPDQKTKKVEKEGNHSQKQRIL